MLIRLVFCFLFASVAISHGFECEKWYSYLEKGLAGYQPEIIVEGSNSSKIYEWELVAQNREEIFFTASEDDLGAGNAILNLWRAKQICVLKLIWWTSKNSKTRLLILSLFKGNFIEGIDKNLETSQVPNFDPARFETKEAKERQQELDCIEKNRIKIHDLFEKYHFLLRNDQFPEKNKE